VSEPKRRGRKPGPEPLTARKLLSLTEREKTLLDGLGGTTWVRNQLQAILNGKSLGTSNPSATD